VGKRLAFGSCGCLSSERRGSDEQQGLEEIDVGPVGHYARGWSKPRTLPGARSAAPAESSATLLIVRYDVAVETYLGFHTRGESASPIKDLPHQPETVAMEFEGRRFLWHDVPSLRVDLTPPSVLGRAREFLVEALRHAARSLDRAVWQERWPTVSTPINDANDYEAERLAMARFLSALAYETRQGMEVVTGGGAGVPAEFDPPVATAVRHRLGAYMQDAPAEVVVVDDDRLRLVLGYYREGLGTESPYFRFLAFWNALEVACEDVSGPPNRQLETWIRQAMRAFPPRSHIKPPADWWDHLWNERRSAVAHATRDPKRGVPDLDPDDPDSRSSFWNDAGMLDDLVRRRVGERWGQHAVYFRRRRT